MSDYAQRANPTYAPGALQGSKPDIDAGYLLRPGNTSALLPPGDEWREATLATTNGPGRSPCHTNNLIPVVRNWNPVNLRFSVHGRLHVFHVFCQFDLIQWCEYSINNTRPTRLRCLQQMTLTHAHPFHFTVVNGTQTEPRTDHPFFHFSVYRF
jgi:hypothetical protein